MIIAIPAFIAVSAAFFWLVRKAMPLVIAATCLCGVLLIMGYIFDLIELMKISGITGEYLIGVAIVAGVMFPDEGLDSERSLRLLARRRSRRSPYSRARTGQRFDSTRDWRTNTSVPDRAENYNHRQAPMDKPNGFRPGRAGRPPA